ncbi:Tyrosine-protein phosphatase domain-containing protein [Caenorhabditis elegans]|uniref:Tyrosine-protein phosphatase domain-containing protein n=1 Tax=Caenorhabditis elegans TaxID=6239 RepID=Q18652_CAEEL|nr:Tyrosine-protein phosphatase domain-containing protein [Caenorhabditis elegans]CCD66587.1 Tyrosine-protein phosphatase domain-containing protein [Caenorhabditis elegans]|eukprot:NP_501277.1 Uncharacterized protein CELE_C46A5.1 [Caenorhabditis elegans]
MKAVDQAPKKKSHERKRKEKRVHTGNGTAKKHHKRKSRSKSKNKPKNGLSCCRKKKKKSKKSKSKVTKKQPKKKVIKPLAPVPNEQLGEVVLVKNVKLPETPQKPENDTPVKDGLKPPRTTNSVEKINLSKESFNLSNEKIASDNGTEEKMEKKNVDSPADIQDGLKGKSKQKSEEKVHQKAKDDAKRGDECNKFKISDEKLTKWKLVAQETLKDDANIAVNEFEKVSGYLPPHISKNHFVSNMDKNRFVDVICMDHSRVKLTDSSYIHANWVDLNSSKKAILTQLPLSHTASDFWQMIIDQKIKCVLLIMTDGEFNKFGGNSVFPQNQDFLKFEDRFIRVGEFKQVELGKGWNLKVLSVSNGTYKTFIHVHHYKNWPHGSIPSDVKQIWQVQSYLRKYTDGHPPVYMSMSGCGRAGTFALFETAHMSLHNEQPSLNMVKCLENVRNGRLHSVQNLSQFSVVYTLIAEHVLGNGIGKKDVEEQENSIDNILRQLTIQ